MTALKAPGQEPDPSGCFVLLAYIVLSYPLHYWLMMQTQFRMIAIQVRTQTPEEKAMWFLFSPLMLIMDLLIIVFDQLMALAQMVTNTLP